MNTAGFFFGFLLVVTFQISAYAEESATQASNQSWEAQRPDQLKVKFGVSIPRYEFHIQAPKSASGKVADFKPNTPGKANLNFAYRNVAATVSTIVTSTVEDEDRLGSSSGTDFQIRFYGKQTYEFFYQSYKGYFLDNSEELDPAYAGQSKKILLPDLETKNYGFNFFWNLNDDDFSFAVAFDQNGHQLESNWGLSWFAHFSESRIHNPDAFVPASSAMDFGSMATLNDLNRLTLAGGMGIGGIAVKNNFYLTGVVAAGLGYQSATLKGVDGFSDNSTKLGGYSTLRAGLGYNGSRHVVGVQVLGESVTTPVDDGEIAGSLLEVSAFYAYRFEPVSLPPLDWVSKWFD